MAGTFPSLGSQTISRKSTASSPGAGKHELHQAQQKPPVPITHFPHTLNPNTGAVEGTTLAPAASGNILPQMNEAKNLIQNLEQSLTIPVSSPLSNLILKSSSAQPGYQYPA